MTRMTIPVDGAELAVQVEGAGSGPRLLMIHENVGLTPYMSGVAHLLADAGYAVVAPDLLSRLGGTSQARQVTTRNVATDVHVADLCAVVDHFGGVDGIVGFCFGAEMGWELITRRTARAAVLFYGIGPRAVSAIQTPVLALYAQHDQRVNATIPALCEILAESAVEFRLESFPGTRHAFHDHCRPERYDARAASIAWQESVDFLRERVGGRSG